MQDNSIISRLDKKINAVMTTSKSAFEANEYLNEAKKHETKLIGIVSELAAHSQQGLTEAILNQIRYHAGAMHAALRCVKSFIKAEVDNNALR